MWPSERKPVFYAGLCLSTCVGLFLFTRIQIPDVMLTLTIAACPVGLPARSGRGGETAATLGRILGASLGTGFCSKSGWHGVSDRGGAAVPWAYQANCFPAELGSGLRPMSGLVIVLIIAAALACVGHRAECPLFCVDLAERTRPVSRIFVVLFCE